MNCPEYVTTEKMSIALTESDAKELTGFATDSRRTFLAISTEFHGWLSSLGIASLWQVPCTTKLNSNRRFLRERDPFNCFQSFSLSPHAP